MRRIGKKLKILDGRGFGLGFFNPRKQIQQKR